MISLGFVQWASVISYKQILSSGCILYHMVKIIGCALVNRDLWWWSYWWWQQWALGDNLSLIKICRVLLCLSSIILHSINFFMPFIANWHLADMPTHSREKNSIIMMNWWKVHRFDSATLAEESSSASKLKPLAHSICTYSALEYITRSL